MTTAELGRLAATVAGSRIIPFFLEIHLGVSRLAVVAGEPCCGFESVVSCTVTFDGRRTHRMAVLSMR
jgi:hypothetical protein